MPEDLVSVIVPVYNSEQFLCRCLDSVIGQEYRNIEVVLVNDGSTDKSAELCECYARRDKRVKLIHSKNNGPAQARNIGIENAVGDFIFFVDSDDFIENNALSVLIDNYRRTNADVIIGDARSVKDGILGPGYKGCFLETKLLVRQEIADYARQYLKKPNRFTLFAYSWEGYLNLLP
ncbi:MAG: glycosyltransferase family 2 protein [Candidatus Omnitrophota bacterium]